MALIFDVNSAKLYHAWYKSTEGRAMDKWVGESILSLLDPRPGERVLDIGCGEGNHLLFFSKLGLDINGIDASPYMISRAKERLGDCCTLKTGQAEALPYEDNEFDLSVIINTLEFLDDPEKALMEAVRVTNRKVFIGVMNSFSWHYLANRIKGIFNESPFNHAKFLNLWQLKSYVRRAFGEAPIAWNCTQIWPSFLKRFGTDLWNLEHCPVGAFLGLSASILYWVKTDNLPLKVRLKKARRSIVSGATMDNLNRMNGGRGDERSLSL